MSASRHEEKRFFWRGLCATFLLAIVLGTASPVASAMLAQSRTAVPSASSLVGHEQTGDQSPSKLLEGPLSSEGKVIILADNQDDPQPMAVSGGYVYWYDLGSGQVERVADSGGKVQSVANTTSSGTVPGLLVSGHYLYWEYWFLNDTFRFYKTDVLTLMTRTIYSSWSVSAPGPFAISGGHIYFVLGVDISRVNTDGSGFTFLAIYPSPCPYEAAFSDGVVYWLDTCTGQVGSVPAFGGTPKLLSPQLSTGGTFLFGVTMLLVVGDHIYWDFNGWNNSSVNTVSTSGADFKMLYSTKGVVDLFGGLGYSQGRVVFAALFANTGMIASVAHDGGPLHVVAYYPAAGLEVPGETIYFTNPLGTVGKTKV